MPSRSTALLNVKTAQSWDHTFGEHLVEFALEQPQSGFTGDSFRMPLRGRAVGATGPVEWLQVSGVTFPAVRLPVTVRRPDVAERHPDRPWAETSGFEGGISALKLEPGFSLHLSVVLGDETTISVGRIRGEWRAPIVEGHSRLQPLIVTTLGRTGSTWFTGLLAQHPEIFVFGPYRYEPRAAWYWMDVLGSLSESQSYQQLIAPEAYGPSWWVGSARRLPLNPMVEDPDVRRWLDTGYAERLRRMCRTQIDEFYDHAAPVMRHPRAHYFVEKVPPASTAQAMLGAIYPRMKEIFLVRDFRDMACSALAFAKKTGFPGFGREFADSDEEFVTGPLLESALAMVQTWRDRSHRAHLVRYEDLVNDPQPTLRALLRYLEVDATDELIDRMVTEGVDIEAQEDHQTARSVADSVGRWRRDLSKSVNRAFDESYEPVLAEFGYSRD